MNPNDSFGSVIRLVGWGVAVFGGLIFATGLLWLAQTVRLLLRSHQTTGTIIELVRSSGGATRRGATYSPVYSFADGAGVVHTQRSSTSYVQSPYQPEDKIPVLYDPANPKDSRIKTFGTLYGGPVLILVVGLAIGGFAWLWLFLASRVFQGD